MKKILSTRTRTQGTQNNSYRVRVKENHIAKESTNKKLASNVFTSQNCKLKS